LNRLYTPDRVKYPVRCIKPPHIYFSHLFNSYAQAYNNMYARHGSLFERPFKRKLISSEKYFKRLVLYIHNNPVHHGFCDHPVEYPWSSYIGSISDNRIKVEREIIVKLFDSLENYISVHKTNAKIIENEEP
jgi:putative transposase